MLEKFKELLKKDKKELKLKTPRHIAITMHGIKSYTKKEEISLAEGYKKGFEILLENLEQQIALKIPIFRRNFSS